MTNKRGINLLLWGVEMTEDLLPVLNLIKETGYDTVEIPIMNTDIFQWKNWKKRLDELGLNVVAETINGRDLNSIDKDPDVRTKALEFNKGVIDVANFLEAELFIGPYHSALGVFTGEPATNEEKKWAAENLWHLAEHGQKSGVMLGLEYLNRFESYLCTCTDETLELIDLVDHPNCQMMFDTFHANIEEKDLAEAIKKIGKKLVHVQLSENDRGTLGAGHIDFPKIVDALKGIDYQGVISVEAFSQKLSAAHIWRQMFESEEQLVKDSYVYLDKLLG
ncbi:sugar phosphate isomerase/epimerase [Jiulongibacter sediminis]|jgi:D-psicose/D-tagatose/L-ribulose 3-epimerase|uniref:sugar phosphate isomerase/epimerase family protein n=1 Tax=Jiulongibacter sediminis TaxID=1605367 RepID=UPI0026F13F35|nr:sugar phosphate isomerase/epimerase family protein [Jiulongibacter sediminis]